MQILSTLELVHKQGMFNADIKPSNVLLYNNEVVLCDWGSAVFVTEDNPVMPVRSIGTEGYCDFTILEPAPSNASHDLMALARTIYVNYTDQFVPNDQVSADNFWSKKFHEDSLWKEAMEYARESDYVKLKNILMLL